jgi:hypothetical protein
MCFISPTFVRTNFLCDEYLEIRAETHETQGLYLKSSLNMADLNENWNDSLFANYPVSSFEKIHVPSQV